MQTSRLKISALCLFALGITAVLIPLTPCTAKAQPEVDLGEGHGVAGGSATIVASLAANGSQVAAVSNAIIFNALTFSITPATDCTINPAIGASTPADKSIIASLTCTDGGPCDATCTQPNSCNRALVGIFGMNQNEIPDGELFTCRFSILANAVPGTYVLENSAGASNPNGLDISGTTGANGALRVLQLSAVPTANYGGVVLLAGLLTLIGWRFLLKGGRSPTRS